MKKIYYTEFKSEFFNILVAGNEDGVKIVHPETETQGDGFPIDPLWERNDSFFVDAVKQLKEYFTGVRKTFDLRLDPEGTEFQKRVWKELLKIPYGETRSYGEIARNLGNPNASRAVGAANGRNPVPIIIPCHRVIGSGGKLTGYAFGLDLKSKLLDLEAGNN